VFVLFSNYRNSASKAIKVGIKCLHYYSKEEFQNTWILQNFTFTVSTLLHPQGSIFQNGFMVEAQLKFDKNLTNFYQVLT